MTGHRAAAGTVVVEDAGKGLLRNRTVQTDHRQIGRRQLTDTAAPLPHHGNKQDRRHIESHKRAQDLFFNCYVIVA